MYVCETEQDEGLEKLEETVISTKHIALAVNEELDLHSRLIVCFLLGSLVLLVICLIKTLVYGINVLCEFWVL